MPTATEDEWCVLDIETTGGHLGHRPWDVRLLVAGVMVRGESRFYEAEARALSLLYDLLSTFRGVVVTFNGTRFDLPVLHRHFVTRLRRHLSVRRHYDILAHIEKATGRRISLSQLSLETLGVAKPPWDHTKNGRIWKQNPHLLLEHNRADLELTARIFERIGKGEALKVWGRELLLAVPHREVIP